MFLHCDILPHCRSGIAMHLVIALLLFCLIPISGPCLLQVLNLLPPSVLASHVCDNDADWQISIDALYVHILVVHGLNVDTQVSLHVVCFISLWASAAAIYLTVTDFSISVFSLMGVVTLCSVQGSMEF